MHSLSIYNISLSSLSICTLYSMDFSSFTSILFRSRSSLSSSSSSMVMQTPNSSPTTVAEPGLKFLTVPTVPPNHHHHHNGSFMMIRRVDLLSSSSSTFSPASVSPSSLSMMDETNKKEELEVVEEGEEEEEGYSKGFSIRNQRSGLRREFPPLIPYLAWNENLSGQMPWVLKRSYKKDGRLVIKEVKNEHHEYFKAYRANGRLTLKLMHMDTDQLSLRRNTSHVDDDDDDGDVSKEEEQQESQFSSRHHHRGLKMSSDDVIVEEDERISEKEEEEKEEEGVIVEEQKQHDEVSSEIRESLILASSSLIEGRVGCVPNNMRSTLHQMSIPTARPILIGRID